MKQRVHFGAIVRSSTRQDTPVVLKIYVETEDEAKRLKTLNKSLMPKRRYKVTEDTGHCETGD